MTKCSGCGIEIENAQSLCERCFRIKHYNEYKVVVKDNTNFIPILETINQTQDLVLLVVDLFNIQDLSMITKYITNDIILVLTKRDILPKSIFEDKLLQYNYHISCKDKIIISSYKNYQFDELLDKIKKHQVSKNVYVVGFTNAGKSTMINKLIYHYSDYHTEITTSPLPNTTLNVIEVKLNDGLYLIDTPGLLEKGDITNYLSGQELKKVIPNKEIRPITYQIKGKQILMIDKYVRIEAEDIDLTFFISNQLKIERYYNATDKLLNLKKHVVLVDKNDIVIKGLGFIKTNKKSVVTIYTLKNVEVFTRKSLI